LGRSRGGFGSKFHLVTDGQGVPLAVHVTAGQVHESTQFEEVMNIVKIQLRAGLSGLLIRLPARTLDAPDA
jgi:transposase